MGVEDHIKEKLSFVSFCIEEYKTFKGMNGMAVSALFDKSGVFDYLTEHYDILHSFSREAILSDIQRFIDERRSNQ